jgi:selenocysteine lyase
MTGEFEIIEDTKTKVYLDYNATTPLSNDVLKAINDSLKNNWANPSGNYEKSKQSKMVIDQARNQLAVMINSDSSSDILFTSGGTEANNMVFHSVLHDFNSNKQSNFVKPHIIISSIEHDSVKLVVDYFVKNNMAEASEVKTNKNGIVNMQNLIDSIKQNTCLISLMLANNETGVIQPVKFLSAKLEELGYNRKDGLKSQRIFIHTDAAQAIGKIKVDVQDLDVDYLTIVGHKFYGPRIGALYARRCQSDSEFDKAPLYPLFFGGNQENSLRPGTENTPMIVGLGKAAELVTINLQVYNEHMKEIRDYLESSLESEFGSDNLHFNGKFNTERLPNTCNVSFIANQKLNGKRILNNTKYLEASTGACCHSNSVHASRVLIAMNVPVHIASNSIRFSVGRETQKRDIDIIIKDLKETMKQISF